MPLHITDLRCEHLINPLGLAIARPRLSWRMEIERRGARQVACRIIAAASADLQSPLLWDSGRIETGRSLDMVYDGPPLASGQRVYWQVQLWDDAGETALSTVAWWEMGLLTRVEWAGDWIGAPLAGGPRTTSPAPHLRTSFRLNQVPTTARLYATALGLYECRINGARIGEDCFTPGWTDYHQRVQYQVYDVGPLLMQGENVLGAILGDGWYCGSLAWATRQYYGDRPRFLAHLLLSFADGSRRSIVTDNSWRVTTGPILESDMIHGESYDARRELTGWDIPGYDDQRWWPAEIFADPGVELSAMRGPPVRRQEQLRPREIRPISDGYNRSWIFDMGQNMVGWARLRVSGPPGTHLTLRFAEALAPDGSLYTANLRSARQTDHYTLRGGEEECWEPRFTFHGFRYVELIGYRGEPTAETITGIVLHSDTPPTGEFACSDELVNQLQRNIIWGQKGNFVDLPTDCPQRDERLGWTGDAQVFTRTAAYNMDVAAFFTRWLRDMADTQAPSGAIPPIVPNIGIGKEDGGPAWADAAVICPWTIYLCYGDERLLEECYPMMQRYVGFLEATSQDGLRCLPDYSGYQGYGDWLALDGSGIRRGGTPRDLIGSAFFAYSARLLIRIARVLGKTEDAAYYEVLFEKIRAAFQARFVTPAGLLAAATQTAYVLALHFDLLPEQLRPIAAAELARDIERRGNHLSTGFVGTPYLPFVLAENGYLESAYTLLLQREWPAWLYAVTQGATTIWERWDGWTDERGFQDPAMNSFNHYAYGAVGAWLYAVVAGIAPDPTQPGYKHILLQPRPGGGFTHARAALQTRYGRVASAWHNAASTFTWEITLPPNTTATAHLPAAPGTTIYESEQPAEDAPGVQFLRHEAGVSVYSLGAGSYRFTVEG